VAEVCEARARLKSDNFDTEHGDGLAVDADGPKDDGQGQAGVNGGRVKRGQVEGKANPGDDCRGC
jgi:hypothetical protein